MELIMPFDDNKKLYPAIYCKYKNIEGQWADPIGSVRGDGLCSIWATLIGWSLAKPLVAREQKLFFIDTQSEIGSLGKMIEPFSPLIISQKLKDSDEKWKNFQTTKNPSNSLS